MGKYSKYKGVSKQKVFGRYETWIMQFSHRLLGKEIKSSHSTEREAALAYDKKCIEYGLEPVNILKRK